MNPSKTPSEFLLEQFEAIELFQRGVRRHQRYPLPHTVKVWYRMHQYHVLKDYPELVELCRELEKTVPLDHPYWSQR